MASEVTVHDIPAGLEVPRPAIRHPARVLAVAGLFGLAGQMLLFDVGLGVNFPIAIALVLAGGLLLRQRATAIDLLDAWLAPAALAFALFAALRADPTIVALDALTSITLTGAAIASFGGRAVVRRSLGTIATLALATIGWIIAGAVPAASAAQRALPSGAALTRRAAPAAPVIRGLVIAIPIVLVFVALFSAADAVFARLVDGVFGIELDLGNAVWRLVLAAVLAWLAAGAFGLAASAPNRNSRRGSDAGFAPRLGTTETLTVLVAVDLVFAVFVALQGAYLFGGLDTLEAVGLTYAEYARRGFFELVAVALLAGALVVGADRLARDRTRALVLAAGALTVLTGVVLVSAALRLRLYQEAYGWTELRLYVLATLVVLAVGVIGLLAALAANRVRWIGHLLVITTLAIGLAVSVIGPVRFITEQNVARVLDPNLVPPHGSAGLDAWYALSLGADAIPPLVRVLPALERPEREELALQLGYWLDGLRLEEERGGWQAWNAGREAARDALEAAEARGELPTRP